MLSWWARLWTFSGTPSLRLVARVRRLATAQRCSRFGDAYTSKRRPSSNFQSYATMLQPQFPSNSVRRELTVGRIDPRGAGPTFFSYRNAYRSVQGPLDFLSGASLSKPCCMRRTVQHPALIRQLLKVSSIRAKRSAYTEPPIPSLVTTGACSSRARVK